MSKPLIPLCALLLFGAPYAAMNAPNQDLEERVAQLEQKLVEAETAHSEHSKRLVALEEAQAKTNAWFRSLNPALRALHGKMDAARRQGFEKAGPNPRAKKAVLDGIQAFSLAVAPNASNNEKEKTDRRR